MKIDLLNPAKTFSPKSPEVCRLNSEKRFEIIWSFENYYFPPINHLDTRNEVLKAMGKIFANSLIVFRSYFECASISFSFQKTWFSSKGLYGHRECSFDKSAILFFARVRNFFDESEKKNQKMTVFSKKKNFPRIASGHVKWTFEKPTTVFPYEIWNVFTQSPRLKSKRTTE